MSDILLQATDVRIHYHSVAGSYKVVDGVDITVNRHEIFGLAGESGCGKSTLVEGIMRLIRPPGDIVSGRLESITVIAPSPIAWPKGCRFHPRCPQVMEICRQVAPPFFESAPGHKAACHLYNERQTIELYENQASVKAARP